MGIGFSARAEKVKKMKEAKQAKLEQLKREKEEQRKFVIEEQIKSDIESIRSLMKMAAKQGRKEQLHTIGIAAAILVNLPDGAVDPEVEFGKKLGTRLFYYATQHQLNKNKDFGFL
jgi:hypothetical protein